MNRILYTLLPQAGYDPHIKHYRTYGMAVYDTESKTLVRSISDVSMDLNEVLHILEILNAFQLPLETLDETIQSMLR